MFKSLFSTRKPAFDPALGDALGQTILSDAKQGKFDTLLREIDAMRNGQWDRRAFYIDLVGEYLTNTRNIETLFDNSTGNLIKGNIAINLAWKARGGGQADTVSKEGWESFFKYLDSAARYLIRAGNKIKKTQHHSPFCRPLQWDYKLTAK